MRRKIEAQIKYSDSDGTYLKVSFESFAVAMRAGHHRGALCSHKPVKLTINETLALLSNELKEKKLMFKFTFNFFE